MSCTVGFRQTGNGFCFIPGESGRPEIYTPFPGPGAKRQISTTVGHYPRWRGDGKEIFCLARLTGSWRLWSPKRGYARTGHSAPAFRTSSGSASTTFPPTGQHIIAMVPRSKARNRSPSSRTSPALKKKWAASTPQQRSPLFEGSQFAVRGCPVLFRCGQASSRTQIWILSSLRRFVSSKRRFTFSFKVPWFVGRTGRKFSRKSPPLPGQCR
jgi:hypothetical protein